MQVYRVSRYSPVDRDPSGRYLKDTWTSVSDIGRAYGGEIFTADTYRRVEAGMLEATVSFYRDAGSPLLLTCEVEPGPPGQNALDGWRLDPPSERERVRSEEQLTAVVRACLRELFWCRLESSPHQSEPPPVMIFTGYDFYLYWSGAMPGAETCAILEREGLFLELIDRPDISS